MRGSERPCELGDYCGVMPDSLDDTGETFPGGSVSGNVCVSVESDQVEGLGGGWRRSPCPGPPLVQHLEDRDGLLPGVALPEIVAMSLEADLADQLP